MFEKVILFNLVDQMFYKMLCKRFENIDVIRMQFFAS